MAATHEEHMGYHITTRIDDRTIAFQDPIADPFVRHTVTIGWRDLLRAVMRRGLAVTIIVGADPATIRRVLDEPGP